jgi:hypothetical protein
MQSRPYPPAVEVDIDVGLLKNEIKKTYASVSDESERGLHLPHTRGTTLKAHKPR